MTMFEAPANFYNDNRKRPGKKWGSENVVPVRINPNAVYRMADILKATTQATGLSVAELTGRCRRKHLVRARHAAWWLSMKHCLPNLTQIGKRWNRDHTTVLHGVEQVEQYPEKFEATLMAIREQLGRRHDKVV